MGLIQELICDFFFMICTFFFEKVKEICEIVDVWKFKPHNFNTRRSIFESPKHAGFQESMNHVTVDTIQA